MASALGDEPVRAIRLTLDSMEMAREVGVRGMYNWLVAMVAFGLQSAGRDWDEHLERMREALETATVRSDRVRLRSIAASFELARGEGLDTIGPELRELVGDSTDPDDRFAMLMTTAIAPLMSGDADAAYTSAMEAGALQTQSPEAAAGLALRAAVWARDPDRMRAAAALVAEGLSTGAVSQAFRVAADGAVAFADGRTGDALDALHDAIERLTTLELHAEAAMLTVDAAILMPAEPEIRHLVEAHRPLLEELRARPILERLDAALASVPGASRAAAAIPVESPSSTS